MNVQLGNGKVHYAGEPDGFMPSPKCGGNRASERYVVVSAEVTCKNCQKIMADAEGISAEDLARAAEALTNKGEITVSEQTEERPAELDTVEQIQANIERAASLAEAENVDGLKELGDETETLISGLPQRGRILLPGREKEVTWAQAKKDFRGEWRQVAQPKPQAEPKAGKAVAKAPAEGTVAPKTYDQYEGVQALVDAGAKQVSEGIKAHIKTSHLAKDVARTVFEMWLRIPNKDDVPDLTGSSDPAKKASGAMLKLAGEGFEHNYDTEDALKKLMRSVQTQRTDVRAEWLRSLDGEGDEADERRALVAKVLEGKPEETAASAWVASKYGVSLKGEIEKARDRYQEKKALESGEAIVTPGGEAGEGEGEGEGEATPDERVASVAKKLLTDIRKANPDDFEHASEDTKESVREQLEEALTALKAMIAATL
jgi:hypothetical protein